MNYNNTTNVQQRDPAAHTNAIGYNGSHNHTHTMNVISNGPPAIAYGVSTNEIYFKESSTVDEIMWNNGLDETYYIDSEAYKFGSVPIISFTPSANDITLVLGDGRVISVKELDQRLSDLEERLAALESDKEFNW